MAVSPPNEIAEWVPSAFFISSGVVFVAYAFYMTWPIIRRIKIQSPFSLRESVDEMDEMTELSQTHGVRISNSYATGNVTAGEGSSDVGGFIGGIHTDHKENDITPDEQLHAAWMSAAINDDIGDLRNTIYIYHYDIDLKHLADPDSYFEIVYQLRSSSVFTLDVGKEITGHVFYDDTELERIPEIRKPIEQLQRKGHDQLILRQWVSQSVMNKMAKDRGNEVSFHFKEVNILVEAKYPDGTTGPHCRLNIPSHVLKRIPGMDGGIGTDSGDDKEVPLAPTQRHLQLNVGSLLLDGKDILRALEKMDAREDSLGAVAAQLNFQIWFRKVSKTLQGSSYDALWDRTKVREDFHKTADKTHFIEACTAALERVDHVSALMLDLGGSQPQ